MTESVLERMERIDAKKKIADFMVKEKMPYDFKIRYDREHSTIALGREYGIDPAYVWRIINGQKRKRIP